MNWSGWAQVRGKEWWKTDLKQMWLEICSEDHSVCWFLGRAHPFPTYFWPKAQIVKIQAMEDKSNKSFPHYIEVYCTFGVQEFQLSDLNEHNNCLKVFQACLEQYRQAGNTIPKPPREAAGPALIDI